MEKRNGGIYVWWAAEKKIQKDNMSARRKGQKAVRENGGGRVEELIKGLQIGVGETNRRKEVHNGETPI